MNNIEELILRGLVDSSFRRNMDEDLDKYWLSTTSTI